MAAHWYITNAPCYSHNACCKSGCCFVNEGASAQWHQASASSQQQAYLPSAYAQQQAVHTQPQQPVSWAGTVQQQGQQPQQQVSWAGTAQQQGQQLQQQVSAAASLFMSWAGTAHQQGQQPQQHVSAAASMPMSQAGTAQQQAQQLQQQVSAAASMPISQAGTAQQQAQQPQQQVAYAHFLGGQVGCTAAISVAYQTQQHMCQGCTSTDTVNQSAATPARYIPMCAVHLIVINQ